jgi:hypothetical protein
MIKFNDLKKSSWVVSTYCHDTFLAILRKALWCIDPLLSNNHETNNETTAAAREDS